MDNLINSITSTSDSGITLTLPMAIVAMAAALIFGLVISLTYIGTHKNKYQQSFAITLTMLPIILTVIILFVGSNVARAFSLAGTLSIIRFRSAPGDPEDIGYIFFDIAAGLACGVGLYGYGALFVLLLCLFMIVITKIKFGKPNTTAKNLKITLVKSKIGQVPKNVKIVNAMGLHKINSTVVLPDNASVRGMIQKVNHMIKVEEVEA